MKERKLTLTRFIWKYIRLQPWAFFFIFFLSLTWSLDATVWPYILRRVVDIFTRYDGDRAASWEALKPLLIIGFCLWVFVEIAFRSRDFIRAKAFPKLEADMRIAMFDHIQHHSPHYFNQHFAGSLSNKVADMTTQVSQLLFNLMLFLPALATCIVSVVLFFQINPLFAAILGAWIVVHFAICISFTPKCAEYSHIHGESRSRLAGKIVDSLTNNFTVNLFARFAYEKSRIAGYQKDELEKNSLSQRYVAWMFVCTSVIFITGGVLLNGFMIYYWMKGTLSTGITIQVFNTMWNVVMVMWFSGEMIPQFFRSIGVATQAFTVMRDPQDVLDVPHAKPLVVKEGEIVFNNVSFNYGAKGLFENKSVHIQPGEKVGLVGYSGAGKSTFVNLILRFYPLKSGKILIDGQDIANVTLESLRNQVTLIPQDPLLFHRTLEENIAYGKLDASFEEIQNVSQLAHCEEFISRCPDGYQTFVGERGTKLSGGERQRIAIARAMLVQSPILILDEATSALDSVTENYIQESLEKLMQDRTTIVIAHRLSTLSKMDRIFVFDHGKIVEQGSHTDLLAKGGHFAKMWHMQAGGFLPE